MKTTESLTTSHVQKVHASFSFFTRFSHNTKSLIISDMRLLHFWHFWHFRVLVRVSKAFFVALSWHFWHYLVIVTVSGVFFICKFYNISAKYLVINKIHFSIYVALSKLIYCSRLAR